jgi:hypothetical protein
MPYRLRNARQHYGPVDKRTEAGTRNAALAANMKRLRAGRSIGVLRAEMAAKGLKIGTETLHRAIKGEAGNRLESLEKIADFFDTTVDQLLQFEGVDETYWPFSAELQQIVLRLSDEELLKAENVLRAHLGVAPISSSAFNNIEQFDSGAGLRDAYPVAMEEGAGALDEAEIPASKSHAHRKVRQPARRKGGRGA